MPGYIEEVPLKRIFCSVCNAVVSEREQTLSAAANELAGHDFEFHPDEPEDA
jgi:hypothetical protein